MSLKAFILGAGVLTATLGTANAAVVYNAVNDFSGVNGSPSAWSYAYVDKLGTLTALDTYLAPVGGSVGSSVNGWHNADGSCCGGDTSNNSVLIAKNTSGGTVSYETIVQPADYLESDPEGNRSSDLIFTAPTSGTYTVSFDFLGIDIYGNRGPHGVDVLVNGSSAFSGLISGYGVSAGSSFTRTLAAGSIVDFQVLTSPDTYAFLSTGVQAEISLASVPLTASLPMFGAALLALAGFGYRINRPVARGDHSA